MRTVPALRDGGQSVVVKGVVDFVLFQTGSHSLAIGGFDTTWPLPGPEPAQIGRGQAGQDSKDS